MAWQVWRSKHFQKPKNCMETASTHTDGMHMQKGHSHWGGALAWKVPPGGLGTQAQAFWITVRLLMATVPGLRTPTFQQSLQWNP